MVFLGGTLCRILVEQSVSAKRNVAKHGCIKNTSNVNAALPRSNAMHLLAVLKTEANRQDQERER